MTSAVPTDRALLIYVYSTCQSTYFFIDIYNHFLSFAELVLLTCSLFIYLFSNGTQEEDSMFVEEMNKATSIFYFVQ